MIQDVYYTGVMSRYKRRECHVEACAVDQHRATSLAVIPLPPSLPLQRCQFKCGSVGGMQYHYVRCAGAAPTFKCSFCSRSYMSKTGLNYHQLSAHHHHGDTTEEVRERCRWTSTECSQHEAGRFICSNCVLRSSCNTTLACACASNNSIQCVWILRVEGMVGGRQFVNVFLPTHGLVPHVLHSTAPFE